MQPASSRSARTSLARSPATSFDHGATGLPECFDATDPIVIARERQIPSDVLCDAWPVYPNLSVASSARKPTVDEP